MIDGGGGNQAPPFLHPLKHFAEISSALASFASCEFAPAANGRFGKAAPHQPATKRMAGQGRSRALA